jgi:hypothetical protein
MRKRSWIRQWFTCPVTHTLRKAPHRRRPALEVLEDRCVPSTFLVNNTLDTFSGGVPTSGTLRWAVDQANSTAGANTIVFDQSVFTTPQTITLSGQLDVASRLDLSNTTGMETITGPAAGVTVSGGGQVGVFEVARLVTASISGLTISGGSMDGGVDNNGTLTLTNCTVSHNSSAFYGGVGNVAGGLVNGGTATLTNCTVSDNSGAGGPNQAGGVFNAGTLTMTNCTISGNSGKGFGNCGGGLVNSGVATLTNCTISGNYATYSSSYAGGVCNLGYTGTTATLANTIVAGNAGYAHPDVAGRVSSQGHNLIGMTDGSSGWVSSDLTGTIMQPLNSLLAPLGNNGGPTQTMALLPGSPAIDAGNNALLRPGVTTDQRGPGFARIVNGTVDIGAFEVQNGSTNQASNLAVAGFPSVTTAGVAGSFTVTALNADGGTDASYTGTIHFSSSDAQASLPADYTFTTADQGVHTFNATLKTAATQSLTATATTAGSVTGIDTGIAVNAAAASKVIVTGFPSPTTAGVAGAFTATLEDAYGNIASGYRGTVHFTSSDARASLPANYTFTAADAGVHTFSATLKRAGTQSLTATDTATAGLRGSDSGIIVNPAAASKFILSAPAHVTAGVAFSLTLKVEDAYGNVVTNYSGTVHLSSSDGTATLPANYTFTAADKGVHTFTGLVLRKKGYQKITATDTNNSSLTGSATVDVL